MLGVDERIREDMRRLARPVDASGALERIAARKARRRVVRRLQVLGLAASVLIGTVAGGYGLTRMFATRNGTPAEGSSPEVSVPPPAKTEPAPIQRAIPEEICDRTHLDADMNADGMMDWVEGWATAPECDSADVGLQYWVHVDLKTGSQTGYGYTQYLPECKAPFGCRVLAAPDLDGDGRPELAIRLGFGASTEWFALYRFHPEAGPDDPVLVRLDIAPPGDPWHEEYGFPLGPATFRRFGSVTHLHGLSCDQQHRTLIVATGLRTDDDPDRYDVHVTTLRPEGDLLVVVSTEDLELNVGEYGFGILEPPEPLCGEGAE